MNYAGATAGYRFAKQSTSRITQGWSPDSYRIAEDEVGRALNNNCEICRQPVTSGIADAARNNAEDYSDNNWIAMGPKGQRDVRGVANPLVDPPPWWRFFHCKCVRDVEQHAPNHPQCTRPHGPCTDWHLRGKCKREWKCGHCHFHHPELLEKYPDLPSGGVLRRPQRRERLQMLKMAYEEDIKKYLSTGEVREAEGSSDEEIGSSYAVHQPGSNSDATLGGSVLAELLAQLLKPAETSRVASALRNQCAPGSQGYSQVKPLLEDKCLAPIVTRFVELLEVESQRRCADENLHALVREFLFKCERIGDIRESMSFDENQDDKVHGQRLGATAEFCVASRMMDTLMRRLDEIVDCWPRKR